MVVNPSVVVRAITAKEDVAIPIHYNVSKVGWYGSCRMLTKIVLENVDTVLSGREAFTDIDGRGVVLDKM